MQAMFVGVCVCLCWCVCVCLGICRLIVNRVNNLQCVAVAKLGNVLRSIHFSWLINFRIAQN